MKYNQSGSVLLIVLIFLAIFALLNLFALESNIIENQQVRQLWEQQSVCKNPSQSVRLLVRNGKKLEENTCLK